MLAGSSAIWGRQRGAWHNAKPVLGLFLICSTLLRHGLSKSVLSAGAGSAGCAGALVRAADPREAEGSGRGLDLIPFAFLWNRGWDCSSVFLLALASPSHPESPSSHPESPPRKSLLPASPAPFSIFTATVSQLLPLLMPKAEASTTFPKAPWPRTLPVEAGGQLQVSCIGGRGGVRMEKDGRQR